MKTRVLFLSVALLLMMAGAWAQKAQPAPQGGQPQPGQPGQAGQPNQQPNQPAPWLRMLDMESVIKKADIQRQKINVEAQELLLPIEEKRKALNKQLDALIKDGADGKEAQLAELVRGFRALEKEDRAIQSGIREKQLAIDLQIDKDQDALFEAWVSKLATDKEQAKKLLEMMRQGPGQPGQPGQGAPGPKKP